MLEVSQSATMRPYQIHIRLSLRSLSHPLKLRGCPCNFLLFPSEALLRAEVADDTVCTRITIHCRAVDGGARDGMDLNAI